MVEDSTSNAVKVHDRADLAAMYEQGVGEWRNLGLDREQVQVLVRKTPIYMGATRHLHTVLW